MALLKDLITIPERVHTGDFVLKLSQGLSQPEQTLRDYVVTPQLAEAFKNALGFIQQAVASNSSKAAYLHGSFGSGKSHFMAVLNLLLAGNTQARAIPELADAVVGLTAGNSWASSRKFLMVPYHMIGERDMESAILGHYAEHVRKLHPDAPVPGFYLAEGLFRDAEAMRGQLGDAAFFAKLNEGKDSAGGWGALAAGWTAVSFEAAMLEPPKGLERARLVGDLIGKFFSAYRSLAGGSEAFVTLDDGLAIMSRHAQDLGYDAVILFLDELVLWLASHASDVGFVSREGTKLVKLVEATNADRPIPLVSFVARQRDLRELVGDTLSGAAGVQFTDVLRHWEARFHRINLEDRNLPAIAEKRLLRPVDEMARQTLNNAFEQVLQERKDVLATLLTTDADREMFRKVYPFSPALVQTLIAVSAVLQRERTALKLMLQLLVDRRHDLELGQLIPVGDLWDAIVEGDEPFSEAMRLHFENAKRLYTLRLLPMLELRHGVTWEALKLGLAEAGPAKLLRNDARLLKTLLLAALVPEVESLKGLTANRLAALNHGTFRSPIPGQEGPQVLRRLRDWAGEVGEIKLTDDLNPVLSIQITGVDLEPVLRNAETNDNPGNRRKKVREMLFEQLGIPDSGGLFIAHEFNWRGTRREVEVVYENVRAMADEQLKGRTGAWNVVIDFPFDEANRTPNDDLARLNEYRGGSTRTLVWLPSFLSSKALSDLGRLVTLDYILQGERFEQYAGHLSFIDRTQAKALARNQLDSLRIKLRSQLEVVYGISVEPRDAVGHALTADQQFRSLDTTLAPRPPVGADFKSAFEDLLGQLFAHQYPAHPSFDTEIKPSLIKKVWPELRNAIESPQQRGLVADNATRKLVRSVVHPCRIGQMGETHLLVETHWASHFAQQQARQGVDILTVAKLRQWIDVPAPMGLPIELQNLIILGFAAQTNRRFLQHGGPFEPEVDRLPDDLVLREQQLPSSADWEAAGSRAASLFGLVPPQTLSAANVGRLIADLRRVVGDRRPALAGLVTAVRERAARYAPGEPGARQRTAESAQALLAALAHADDSAVVLTLAAASVETSEAAMRLSIGQAAQASEALTQTRWSIFDSLRNVQDQRRVAMQAVLAKLAEVLLSDEHVIPLRARLSGLESDALGLLAVAVVPPPPPPSLPPSPPVPPPAWTPAPAPGVSAVVTEPPAPPWLAKPPLAPAIPPSNGFVVIEEKQSTNLDPQAAAKVLDGLKALLAHEPHSSLSLSWTLVRKDTRP